MGRRASLLLAAGLGAAAAEVARRVLDFVRFRDASSAPEDDADASKVACAFCGSDVELTDRDPISLGVIERWRPHNEAIDWQVYAHRECFMTTLPEDMRVEFPPEWWPGAIPAP